MCVLFIGTQFSKCKCLASNIYNAQNVGQMIKDCKGKVQQKDNVIADQLLLLSTQLSAMHQVLGLGFRV